MDNCSHEVILGLDFLRDCEAYIDRASDQLLIDPTVMSILLESPADQNCYICATEDFLLPTSYAAFVPVELSPLTVNHTPYSVLVEPLSYVL